jgi:hypothetical protein
MGTHGPRHGKVTVGGKSAARYSWDSRPSRSAELESAVREIPRIRGRKDTRRWCKGKTGREHVPAIVFRPWYGHTCHVLEPGSWRDMARTGWHCEHVEQCSVCGRILREAWKLAPSECPDYRGTVGRPA